MCEKVKIVLAVIGIVVQVAAVILFGFTELQVSSYTYLTVWTLCGAVIYRSLHSQKMK